MPDDGVPLEDAGDEATDRELVRRILSCGERAAVDCLWRRYYEDVRRAVAGQFGRCGDDVEDVVSETLMTFIDTAKLQQWRAEMPSIRSWILAIARNKAVDSLRRTRDLLWPDIEDSVELDDPTADPELLALKRSAEAGLMAAIEDCAGCLSTVESAAFYTWLLGGSLTDLARELGKKPNAVHQDLHRAKGKLFDQLLRKYRDLLPDNLYGDAGRGRWRRS